MEEGRVDLYLLAIRSPEQVRSQTLADGRWNSRVSHSVKDENVWHCALL